CLSRLLQRACRQYPCLKATNRATMSIRKPSPGKTSTRRRGERPAPAGRALAPDNGASRDAALDRYDVAILAELQRDARLSNAELAARIGISAAPTWRRVRWLEQAGYITGYRAELDRRKL